MKKIYQFSFLLPLIISPLLITSCSNNKPKDPPNNAQDPEVGQNNIHHQWLDKNPAYFENQVNASNQDNYILSTAFYNQIYSDSNFDHQKQITIVIIANQNIYTEIIDVTFHETLISAFNKLYYLEMQIINLPFGSWLANFRYLQDDNSFTNWLHGLNTHQNYNNYYPLYWVNHQYAQLGALQWKVEPGDIYEISYDVEL